ncbi:type VII secretion protein EccCa [Luteipulveratus flavus]|uniref:Type VII secretion protein EccCa n=1 Tax=Luteipulveratus flavus TaxID=3031728 RepID=A0ABT6C2H2_9MICO|nr:type VII secretion protein EccCa [Luteipulveratus sp. YIM 133296]MDF8263017.1 type VII secretion protein EccCa [Luteipulveratus sp. YIM 133296]
MGTRIVHRPARTSPRPPGVQERSLERPPSLPEGDTGLRGLLMLAPMLGAGASMTVMMLFRGSSLAAVGALMMILTLLASVAMMLSQRGKAARTRQQQRDRYLDYLERQRAALSEAEQSVTSASRTAAPQARALLSVSRTPERLWERRRDDDDFLRARIGTGAVRTTTFRHEGDHGAMQLSDEFMEAQLNRLEDRFSTAGDLPLTVDLDSAGTISVVGDRAFVEHVARVLVAQAATLSSPEDVRLALVVPRARIDRWSWMQWLPHLADQDHTTAAGPMRRVVPDIGSLQQLLRSELHRRLSASAELSRNFLASDRASRFARVLVVHDAHGEAPSQLTLGDREARLGDVGVTVIHLVASRLDEPDDVTTRITQEPADASGVRALVEDYERRDAEPQRRRTTVDPFGLAEADALGRELAALRLSPDSLEHDAGQQALAAADLMGVDDIERLDLDEAWSARPRPAFLRVPIGTDDQGAAVMLDLKEAAQFGMGPHGLCIGATGSGKSEMLRTLVLGLLTTHGPDDVTMVLVDYKGGATFAPFEGAPQVSGIITNLSDDAGLVERVYASLEGEVKRRQQVLKDAGNLADVTAYRRVRKERKRQGEHLPPLPHLLVIIDEFGELLTARPDFIELFLSIGRIGRSIGVHLLLSSQRIEGGKLRGLDTYLSYRIGLRTLSEAESRTVLEAPDAFSLPPLPGYGYLKVDTTIYTRFRSGYVSGPLPEEEDTSLEVAAPEILPMPQYAVLEHDATAVREPADSDGEVSDDEPQGPTVLSTIIEQLAKVERTSAPVWLPPLPRTVTLDEVCGRPTATRVGLRCKRARHLRVPLGLLDDPSRQRQGAWELDLASAGGNVLVIGGPRSGRTTTLRSIVSSLALTHSPSEVSVFVLDLLSSNLGSLDSLPNVGGVGVRMDREVVRRVVEEVGAILAERELLFQRYGAESLDAARALVAEGRAPELDDALLADVVLVVDGFGQITDEFEEIEDTVQHLVRRGSGYGIHVVATVSRWNEVRLNQQTFFGTKIELRLGDPSESGVARKLAETLSAEVPGRCLLDSGLFAQIALPRIDGSATRDDAADGFESLASALRSGTGERAPRIRLLPEVVTPDDVRTPTAPGQVALGLDESDLQTVVLDLDGRDGSLVVLGDASTGRTSLLRHLARSLTDRLTPDELVFAVVDPRRTLQGVIPQEYLGGYATSTALAERLVHAILPELQQRVPTSVEGPVPSAAPLPRIVLLVDDYDVVTAGGSSPFTPLLSFVGMAQEINLHVVLARRVAGASRGIYEQFFMAVRDGGATGLMFSGDRSEGMLLGSLRPQALPRGRAVLVRTGEPTRTVQTVLRAPEASA